jgi:5-oxoprolinase (ATP-hydrolysing)
VISKVFPAFTPSAQVAANHKGIILVKALIAEYGLDVVQAYMRYIQENAEHAVRDLLKETVKSLGASLKACDYMDDGSKINLEISIDASLGSATFDFGGTSLEVYGNINAPRSVSYSAIIYCLRCLVGLEIPLNQGLSRVCLILLYNRRVKSDHCDN